MTGQPTDWFWDLGTTTQPVTYFDWKDGKPDDTTGTENIIMLRVFEGFKYDDGDEDVSTNSWFAPKNMCFICEIDLN